MTADNPVVAVNNEYINLESVSPTTKVASEDDIQKRKTGNSQTPWGIYLTCAENCNGYFACGDSYYTPTAMHYRDEVRATSLDHRAWLAALPQLNPPISICT